MSAQHVTAIRDAYTAFGRGDLAPVLNLLDDDIEWIEPEGAPGVGGTYHGKQAVLTELFARLPLVWDEFAVTPGEFIDGGEHVVVLGELTARDPVSGAPAQAPFAHVWRMSGGRAVWWRCYEDTGVLQSARGAD